MKVALLLRGISYFENYTTSLGLTYTVDFRKNVESLKQNVINRYDDVDIYISTNHNKYDSILREQFKPIDIYYFDKQTSTEEDNVIKGIELIQQNNKQYELIVISRFDINFSKPIDSFNIDCNKVNFIFKEGSKYLWEKSNRTGNVIWILSFELLKEFKESIENCIVRKINNHPNIHDHYVTHQFCYDLYNKLGSEKINFMFDIYQCSDKPNHIYEIVRQ